MTEPVIIRMVYLGKRTTTKGTLSHTWALESDIEQVRLYPKLKGHAIGHIYEVLAPDTAGTQVYTDSATWTPDKWPDQEARRKWSAETAIAVAKDQRKKAEKRIESQSELDHLIEPLQRIAGTLNTRHDVHALAKLVSDRIIDAYYRPI